MRNNRNQTLKAKNTNNIVDGLGGVNNYLSARDSEAFFVLARRGEA